MVLKPDMKPISVREPALFRGKADSAHNARSPVPSVIECAIDDAIS
jgi:hypothetical protein